MSDRQKSTRTPEFPKSQPDNWLTERLQELDRVSRLDADWNSYGAEPPNATALYRAKQVLDLLDEMSFPADRVIPSAEGGVGIAFARDDRYADLECFNTGDVLAVTSDRRTTPDVWDVGADPNAIKFALEKIRGFLAG